MNGPVSTGIVGYGRLGAQAASVLARGVPGLRLSWICEPLEARRAKAAEAHPEVPLGDSFRRIPEGLGAVVLATTPRDEWTPAEFFLSRGVHVIAAPPLAPNALALSRLADIASRGPARLAPLRIYSRHPAWEAFRSAVAEIEDLRLVDIRMATFGPFSRDMPVHRAQAGWILPEVLRFLRQEPVEVSVLGAPAVRDGAPDVGAVYAAFDGGLRLALSLSRVSPEEGLKVLALGERRIAEFYTNHGAFAEARLHHRRAHYEGDVAWTSPDSGPRILCSEEMDVAAAGLLEASRALVGGEPPDLGADLACERILDAGWASARLGGSRVRLAGAPGRA